MLYGARLALFAFLLLLSGCRGESAAPDPLAYRPQKTGVVGGERSELDARIAFLEERMKQRPKAFLEEAELAGLYLQKGKLRQQTQELDKAREWAEKSIGDFPNNGARVVLADLLQMQHKFDESLQILGEILAEEPASQEARSLAVRALLAQGKPEQARQVLEPMLARPGFAVAFMQGQILEAMGDLDGAGASYKEALGHEREVGSASESARLRAVWGRMELGRGNLDMAEKLLVAAKAIPVDLPITDLQCAKLAVARQQWKQAADILRQGFALYQDPLFLMELGSVQEAQGQKDEALKSYQAAADIVKAHPYGHERDRALALLRLDARANKAEILQLMDKELARRRDQVTLDVWKQVSQQLGPLSEPAPFSTANPIAEAAARPRQHKPAAIIPTARNTPVPSATR